MPYIGLCIYSLLSIFKVLPNTIALNRTLIPFIAFFILVQIVGCSTPSQKAKPPNVIIIMADDLGYGDLGSYGSVVNHTPALDKLASEGVRFTDFHSNGVVCSPTRAALLTGGYQQRAGIEGVVTAKNHRHTGLGNVPTIAHWVKKQGYKTGLVGKWHLGYDTLFSPINNGFDYFKGFVSGNIDYHSHIDQEGHYDWWENKQTIQEEGYSTDLITRQSVDFISKNQNHPFLLYVAHEAPHYPFQGRNDPADRTVKGKFDVRGSVKDKPRAYKEMVEAMDEGIGHMVSHLDQLGLLENTLIFFCSDNGATKPGTNAPLRGYKGNVWEGGHRVPAIIYWKGKIKPGILDHTLMTMDVMPTVQEIIYGNKLQTTNAPDGSSFWPLLSGGSSDAFSDRPLFWRYGKNKKAIRLGKWKYQVTPEGEYLFDLKKDVEENENLLEQHSAQADRMKQLLQNWEQEMNAYENVTR